MTRGLAIFRFDAGSRLGLGHLMRCLAIARRLDIDGWRSAVAVSAETARFAGRWLGTERPALVIEVGRDDARQLRERWPNGCDALIVDHYGRESAYERSCRAWAKSIVAIDDWPERHHDCDMLIDPTADRRDDEHDGFVPIAAKRLCGAPYAPLRDEFFALRLQREATNDPTRGRLVVALGGGDSGAILLRLLDALAAVESTRPVDVIAGARTSEIDAITRAVARLPIGSRLYTDTGRIAELLADAALAIGAGGTSAWERACLGIPSLVIEIADNQRDVLASLAHAGAAYPLGKAEDVAAERLGQALRHVADDRAVFEKMSRAAARLCDGLGARRIAVAMCPERDASGAVVSLRPARWSDCAAMLEWQSHPSTRRYARNGAAPSRIEHESWMRRRLDDVRTLLNIVEIGARPVGVLRLDCVDASANPQIWEISILVDPACYGRGAGLAALRTARRMLPEMEFVAEVLPDNERSHRLFRRAGYESRGGRYVSVPSMAAA